VQSENINELITALAKAQAVIGVAIKQKDNPFFRSKYADLPAIWDVIREPLSRNGIAVIQAPQHDLEGNVYLETTIAHASGQWIRSSYPVTPVKPDPQGYASALTYARRYTLSAMCGVVQDDDDGNAASVISQATPTTPPRSRVATITTDQAKELENLVDAAPGMSIETFCLAYKIDESMALPRKDFEPAKRGLIKRLESAE
jgi:hypothetical protein